MRAIAARPEWGASSQRFLSPGRSANSGIIADISVTGFVIVYRIRDGGSLVWIEDIRPIFWG